MTPTFAAGLGVVIAVGLASNVTGGLLRFAAPEPGTPCATPHCESGKGTPASAKRGKRLLNPKHSPSPAVHPAGHRGAATGLPAQDVVVMYRTLGGSGSGNFSGYIMIASRTGRPLGNWTFQFTYPSAQITGVWAGAPVPHGAHSATVTAAQAGGQGQQAQIIFSVSGQAGPPAGCSFDGQACRFTVSQGNGGGGEGGGGGQGGGGYQGGGGGYQGGGGY